MQKIFLNIHLIWIIIFLWQKFFPKNRNLFQTPTFFLNGCLGDHEKKISSHLLSNNLIIQLIEDNARLSILIYWLTQISEAGLSVTYQYHLSIYVSMEWNPKTLLVVSFHDNTFSQLSSDKNVFLNNPRLISNSYVCFKRMLKQQWEGINSHYCFSIHVEKTWELEINLELFRKTFLFSELKVTSATKQ